MRAGRLRREHLFAARRILSNALLGQALDSHQVLGRHHQRVERLRRLVRRRRYREAERCYVLEGAKLLEAALGAGADIEAVYVAAEAARDDAVRELAERAVGRGIRLHVLAKGVLEAVAGTVTPQPVLAVARLSTVPLEELSAATMLIVSAAVRDPGNAGTLLRSAGAAGADGVVFCRGSVEAFNPKTVRASAGALFHLPVVTGGEAGEVLQQIGRWGIRRLAASSRGGADYAGVDLTAPFALVLGNEATGIEEGLLPHLDATVTVPMAGHAESLNVAVAAAIICFEASRQRRRADAGR